MQLWKESTVIALGFYLIRGKLATASSLSEYTITDRGLSWCLRLSVILNQQSLIWIWKSYTKAKKQLQFAANKHKLVK